MPFCREATHVLREPSRLGGIAASWDVATHSLRATWGVLEGS